MYIWYLLGSPVYEFQLTHNYSLPNINYIYELPILFVYI